MVYKNASSREKLRARLGRVIGQLQGLQKRLGAGGSDCLSDMQQIKAANNALRKVAEVYLQLHLDECIQQKRPASEMQKNLQSVIRATFAL